MADLKSFRVDAKAREEGEWIEVGEEWLDLEVRVRGLTDRYHDTVAARSRAAARSLGGDTSKLPTAVARAIVINALCEHVLLDVRNLKDGDQEIGIERFKQILHEPEYYDLVMGVLRATQKVGQARVKDMTEALGNSERTSAGA